MTTKKHDLHIRCDAPLREAFVDVCARDRLSYAQALAHLLEAASAEHVIDEGDFLRFLYESPAERQEITDALRYEYVDFWELVKTGVLAQARKITTSRATIGEVRQNPVRSRKGVVGSAHEQIAAIVQRLIAHNRQCPEERLYLSQSLVLKASGTYQLGVHAYWASHGAEIVNHNAEMGFPANDKGISMEGSLHNRKHAARIQALLGSLENDPSTRGTPEKYST